MSPLATVAAPVIAYLFTFVLPRISGREPVLIMTLGEHQRPMSNKIRSYAAPSVCDMLKLHGKQKRMCKRGKGVPETLIDATKLSLSECQAKFQNERWNCSMGIYRQNILRKSK